MKTCIQCGRELKDGANFCPSCGAAQLEEGPQTDKWGVPLPSGAGKNAPAQQRSQFSSSAPDVPAPPLTAPDAPRPPETPAAAPVDDLWANPPVPDKPKKKGFKLWYVLLPLLAAVLVAGGMFLLRAKQHVRVAEYYDEDEVLTDVEYYDSNGHVTSWFYYENDEISWMEEYRVTDECEEVDTADVEDIDGVESVEVKEVFGGPSEDDLESEEALIAYGYDKRGQVLAIQVFWKDETGEYAPVHMTVYELDAFGNSTHITRTNYYDDVLQERYIENHYVFGRRVDAVMEGEVYGRVTQNSSGIISTEWNDNPESVEVLVKFKY